MSRFVITITPDTAGADDPASAQTTVRVDTSTGQTRITELTVRAADGGGLAPSDLPAVDLELLIRALGASSAIRALPVKQTSPDVVHFDAPADASGRVEPSNVDPSEVAADLAAEVGVDAGAEPSVAAETPAATESVVIEPVGTAPAGTPPAAAKRAARKAAGRGAAKKAASRKATGAAARGGRKSTAKAAGAKAAGAKATPATTTRAKAAPAKATRTRAKSAPAKASAAKAAPAKASPAKKTAGRGKKAAATGSTGTRAYRRMPDPAEVLAAYAQAGSITALAEHYGVPRHTANGWARRLRGLGHSIGRS